MGSFRRDEEPGPTLLFFQDVGQTYLASTNLRVANLRRLPCWQFWGQSITLIHCGLAMLSAMAFAAIWLPRKLLGYLRGVQHPERGASFRCGWMGDMHANSAGVRVGRSGDIAPAAAFVGP